VVGFNKLWNVSRFLGYSVAFNAHIGTSELN
jgi:hypothetical protein